MHKRPYALAVLALGLIAAPPAQAARQRMIYDVYAGGIHVLQAALSIEKDAPGGRYAISLSAQTFGFLGKLVPWRGVFESGGRVLKNDVLQPAYHRSIAWWSDEYEQKEYAYGPNGKFLGLTVTEKKGEKVSKKNKKENLDFKTLADGTTDALSGALTALIGVGKGKPCESASEVFDGQRRYAEKFSDAGADILKASDYNVYDGQATACEVRIEPIAGAWSKKPRGWMSIQEQGQQAGALPTMWAAPMKDKTPAVPVKIRIKTSYGTLMMHLAEYADEAGKRVAENRVR